ncbi:MAG: MBOAT family protein [Anaerolineaceae bacterium]|nr:MBOAT family protein [Anaerolineaceae bacterium]
MQLSHILILAGLALILRLTPPEIRRWLVFAASVVCIYWLQPALPIRSLSFWLPTATLALTVAGWLLTAHRQDNSGDQNPRQVFQCTDALTGGVLLLLALLVGLTRYLGSGDWLLATLPPPVGTLFTGLGLLVVFLSGIGLLLRRKSTPGWILGFGMVFIIFLLLILKTPLLTLEAARGLRQLNGQNPTLAGVLDVRWLGFSYIAFRLIHTLRDRQTGRLPMTGLRDTITYVIFFPSIAAGPIDRLERFEKDFCSQTQAKNGADLTISPLSADLTEAGRRMVIGLLKKFVLADTLALVALNPTNALQVRQPGWMWLLLYLYAFQIFFDFSGYTDIAIAIGRVLGVRLPENFAAPYRKPNLTQFWNSWHMSLTQWFRGYFFNPFVRWLRSRRVRIAPVWVLLLTQVSTMMLIGLWHGVTANFILWGLWHGLGLFFQNRWSETTRAWFAARTFSLFAKRSLNVFSILFTFHYVTLGWVFFLLPTPEIALQVFKRLFHI